MRQFSLFGKVAGTVVAAVLVLVTQASASWTGSLSGTVVDERTLAPVPGATIRIYTSMGATEMGKAVTDKSGAFVINGLRGGNYRLHFEKGGYQRTIVGGIFVRPGERLVEATPIAMYPNGVPLPHNSAASTGCGAGLVQPGETADVYIVCSGE